jgi:Flp pilus assembly protein TadD/peroxiredoxin
MPGQKHRNHNPSRRVFLRRLQWAPLLFLPAPIEGLLLGGPESARRASSQTASLPFADFRLTPHYPLKSPLDEVLRRIVPGTDEYITEKYADEITQILSGWGRDLKAGQSASAAPAKFIDPSIEAAPLLPAQEVRLRSGAGIEVFRRRFHPPTALGRPAVLSAIEDYFSQMSRLETVEFAITEIEITEIEEGANSGLSVRIAVRYCFVGARTDGRREQRTGNWLMRWSRDHSEAWRTHRWEATEETLSRAPGPVFVDVTSQVLGQTESYRQQMLRGIDHWRTVLDGACGLDIYGNNGVAVGDFDDDGFDDIYVCQPAGLPNRLYRNRGDGTFEDVTQTSGVGVLDATACALFADFENRGLQDLLVVCGSGPLLFRNQGKGKFSLKSDAFQFARPPQGTFTHAAIADYDRDGRLDIYFCLYSYYVGLEQYHYPAPYFDARNGPPNFLLHNEGNGKFRDRTAEAGLGLDNDRYSFACAWGDDKSSQWPDLYVANDFGRSNLYRNRGDGTFSVVSGEAGVEDPGAGMSACWLDFDGDGKQDLYVAKMWSAAGMRVSGQKSFHEKDPANVRALYRQHARGNSLYRNRGQGRFDNVSQQAGVEMGGWAWSSDAWDFDHDGWPDLYIANGYVSGPDQRDLSSFFWRQAVGKSPQTAAPSPSYELGWNAINELIRSDVSWSGYERNVFYLNNRDGTFSDVSGVIGLDFPDDSRSFALTDFDHDGRLEVVLKNRNAPQLRIARNVMQDLGNVLALRLRGTKSNRDAIGASVTVEAGPQRQTKYLQAGSGFLSQHTKELFFGLGKVEGAVRATIAWPSGLIQTFEALPGNHRIEIEEGSDKAIATAFLASPASQDHGSEPQKMEALPSPAETWLIEPLAAPDFSLPDRSGKMWDLQAFRGGLLLLEVCAMASPASREQLRILRQSHAKLASSGLRIVALSVDAVPAAEPPDAIPAPPLPLPAGAAQEDFPFPVLLATAEVADIYNITYRYLFDRHRDLGLPTAFLIDHSGNIVKLYQGPASPESLLRDVASLPRDAERRLRQALPFPGLLCQDSFQRNLFTYGVALFQRGLFDQAAESFKQVIAAKPENAEAYYNLGTLYLRRNSLREAEQCLRQTVQLRPNYPEAWNNLGMLAAQQGRAEEAVHNFQEALRLRPAYATALLNLGNVYRRQENLDEAEKLLGRAFDSEPENPEVNYALGMLYARRDQGERAAQYLETAVALRPDYADALNNLGVLLVRERRYGEAEAKFKACIQKAPNFDQAYLNLARLYVMLGDKEKARAVLQSLLQRQPQHKLAQQALEMLY